MNARPYIFGCLCLVGAAGTAAAHDIDPASSLFSLGGTIVSSFEGAGSSHAQGSGGSREATTGSDVMSTRPSANAGHAGNSTPSPTASPDVDDSNREGPAPIRAPAPSWQSLLPGSML
ncbi:hypothetical protein KPL74_13570 [Bacillus sp. NP157]|nr:hypothetical protein KPL74_13570 [Bacillus sp. NP157]